MQPSDVAVKANKFDPNTQSFTPATPAITPSLAAFNQQMVNAKPPALDTITSDTMKGVTPVPLATPVDNTNDLMTQGNKALADITTQAKIAEQDYQNKLAEGKKTSSEYSNMQLLLGNRGQDTMDTYNTKDSTGESLNDIYKQIAGYKARAENLELDKSKAYLQTQQESIGRGRTEAGIAPLDAAKQRSIAIEKLSLAQDTNIATAKYDAAKNYADQIINAKYDKLDAELKAKQTNLQALKDFDLSPAQEKARLAREERLNAEKLVNEDKRTNEKALSDLVIKASSQGAPSALLEKAKLATNPMQAATILGAYAGDYWETKLKIAQYNKTLAETAKTNAERANAGATTVGGVPGNSPAQSWLSQYNSGAMSLEDIYSKIGSSKTAEVTKNQLASLIAAQGGKRVLPMDDSQVAAIDEQIKNINDLVGENGYNYKVISGALQGGALGFGGLATGAKGDALAIARNLVSNQTLQSLADAKAKGITFGALSEAELSAVANAASRIASKVIKDESGQITGFSGSESGFKDDLLKVKKGLEDSKRKKTGLTPIGGVAGQVDLADKIINTPSGGGTGGYQFNN